MIINICEVVAGDRDGKDRMFVIQFTRRSKLIYSDNGKSMKAKNGGTTNKRMKK
jgi:hypothetical protein